MLLLLQSGPGRSGAGGTVAVLTLSADVVAEDASIGDTIGTLAVLGGTGSYTFALTSDPSGLFAIAGANLNVDDSLIDGSYFITVEATGGTPTPVISGFTITVTDVAVDPYLDDVVLLMGFTGADAATGSPGMDDESVSLHGTATVNGDAEISTDQAVFGGSSLALDGTGDWLTFPTSADWHLTDQPFTVEFRVRPTAIGFGFLIGQWQTAPDLGWIIYQNNFTIGVAFSTTGTDNNADLDSGSLAGDTWFAVALDFDGTTYRLYVDGVMVDSSTTLRDIHPSTLDLSIGASQDGNFPFAGYLEEIRITKDVARYADDGGYTLAGSAFVRPPADLTLSNSAIDKAATIGSTVGTLAVTHGTGSYSFSLTSNPGSLFAISGSNLNVDAVLTGGNKPITVEATGGTPSPVSHNFTISVAELTLSDSTIDDTALVGDTVGVLAVGYGSGSYTFTLTSDPSGLFVISGANLNVAATVTAGSYPITVQAAGGVPTPISQSFMMTVVATSVVIEGAWFNGLPYPGIEVAARDAGTVKYWFNGGAMPILKD